MDTQEIETMVKKSISQILGVDESTITTESRFVEDLGAESIQSLELIAAFEDEFDIEMEEDAALQVKTVGNAVEFIQKYIT